LIKEFTIIIDTNCLTYIVWKNLVT